VLDATRCISYLTIEARGAIPEALREAVGGHVYGCDVCNEVCPWNQRFARALPADSPFHPRAALAARDPRTLARELLGMTQEEFSRAFRDSPMKRAKLRGLKRNAAVVLGNVGTRDDAGLLGRVQAEEPDEMVREHAGWAAERLRDTATSGSTRPKP
jgi:epoxyqueuosine reductase